MSVEEEIMPFERYRYIHICIASNLYISCLISASLHTVWLGGWVGGLMMAGSIL